MSAETPISSSARQRRASLRHSPKLTHSQAIETIIPPPVEIHYHTHFTPQQAVEVPTTNGHTQSSDRSIWEMFTENVKHRSGYIGQDALRNPAMYEDNAIAPWLSQKPISEQAPPITTAIAAPIEVTVFDGAAISVEENGTRCEGKKRKVQVVEEHLPGRSPHKHVLPGVPG